MNRPSTPPGLQPGQDVVASVCCYCGTGCGVRIHTAGRRVIQVAGDPDHPSSLGKLCSKGMALAQTVRNDDSRVLGARWRSHKNGPQRPIALEAAFDLAADKLAQVIQSDGADAIGFYLSGQLLTEDYAVFNKLARALVGTNNIDTNSRLCMSSAVSGYKATLGADAPPACYEDLDSADTVLIAGSNMAYAHPVLFRRLAHAKAARPDMKIIVVDPRRTDTCDIADLHLAIAPGTDVALFHAMLNVLIWDGMIDARYIQQSTQGFDDLKRRIHEFTPRAVQDICGVAAEDIARAARWFGSANAALSLYAMGLNQSSSGTAKNAALIHLHLATGQIGMKGAGPFSLTGQPNAMGGREAGGMANLLPGHRDPANAQHRHEVAALWGVEALPSSPGHTAIDMFDAVLQGKIKVLWIAATNPAQSMPDQSKIRAALRKAEMVIVQEAFANTETLAYADLVLPAATWPEKEGTVTNSERRISRVRAAIAPAGEAMADWELACAIAQRLAVRIAPHKRALFDYPDEAAIFGEHARCTAGRDLDYSALSYAVLDAEGPQQWPYSAQTQGTARLYEDGRFPTGNRRARFMDVGYTPLAENISAQYPLHLTTGRLRDQWHTMSRTGLVPALTRHAEEPFVALNKADMRRFRLASDALVKVKSRRGHIILPAQACDSVRPGQAFIPMHWGSGFIAGDGINALATSARDPISHQPELKHSAVGIEIPGYEWQACAWVQGPSSAWRGKLSKWLAAFPYAAVLPTAIGKEGVRLRVAATQAPRPDQLDELVHDLQLGQADLAFDDPARGLVRRIGRDGRRIKSFLLAGDTRAQDVLLNWAQSGVAPENLTQILMGRGPAAVRLRIVCTCENVSDQTIQQAIDAGHSLEQLKETLKCGTGCGSCIPQINQMIRLDKATAAQQISPARPPTSPAP